MSDSQTVARRDGVLSIGTRARGAFDEEQVALIKATVAKDCSTAELGMFLELAVRYELDPFCREIFAAKMGGRDGSQGRVAIIVGRDGFLKIANRHDDFRGMKGDVVRENDDFRKSAADDIPEHTYMGNTDTRGAIVGAWATVFREGRQAMYFYAPLSEYMPKSEGKLRHSPWGSQESVMILKCAQSTCLRLAFSITGLVGEEEASRMLQREAEDAGETDWGSDPTLAAWLQLLFDAANATQEDIYRPAKIRTMMRGRSDEEREEFAVQLVAWLAEHDAEVPERPTLEDLLKDVPEEVLRDEDTEVVADEPTFNEGFAEGDVPFPDPGDPDVRRGATDA